MRVHCTSTSPVPAPQPLERGLLGGDDVVEGVLADALVQELQPLLALRSARGRHPAAGDNIGVMNKA